MKFFFAVMQRFEDGFRYPRVEQPSRAGGCLAQFAIKCCERFAFAPVLYRREDAGQGSVQTPRDEKGCILRLPMR